MTRPLARVRRDERGAALVLAIGFMLLVGAVSAGLLTYVNSGLSNRTVLDVARNREYAADGGIESAIAQVRAPSGPVVSWSTAATSIADYLSAAQCGGPYPFTLNGVDVRVDCAPAPALTRAGYYQFNVIFSAVCVDAGCPTTPIVRAQINFNVASGSLTRTYVQSWSVDA